jgi:hypothetical protein
MMMRLAGWRAKGVAPGDTEIAFVGVADIGKKSENFWEIGTGCQNDVEIDNGFGGKARDGGAADVFYRQREIAESSPNCLGQF